MILEKGSNIDSRLEAKLGFDRIRKAISDRCSTDYAVQRVATEEFSTDPAEIRKRLLLTDEMRLIVMFEDSFPSSGYVDCTGFLTILQGEGANIDLLSLGKLRTMMETMRKVTGFFANIKDGYNGWPKSAIATAEKYAFVIVSKDGTGSASAEPRSRRRSCSTICGSRRGRCFPAAPSTWY